jgi:peptide-methionine (R)-S-oxide reductase
MSYPVEHTEKEWRKILSRTQYHVLRESGTEPPFHNEYWDNKEEGIYLCAGCGNELFSSQDKYESGTGWPSFSRPLEEERVELDHDLSHGMVRTEVRCARCGGHLGHVFDDGPAPTGQRYCMNSASLDFRADR